MLCLSDALDGEESSRVGTWNGSVVKSDGTFPEEVRSKSTEKRPVAKMNLKLELQKLTRRISSSGKYIDIRRAVVSSNGSIT